MYKGIIKTNSLKKELTEYALKQLILNNLDDFLNQFGIGFKYVGNVNLRGKSRSEKLTTISQYFSQGYYLTAEVKGATKGSQHWVAITGVDSVNVMMVDPASDQTIMWNAYEVGKTTQFNYFKAE